MNKHTAAIIGLGQVGQGYDYENLDSSIQLTHATALKYHNEFDLIAAVDSSKHQRSRYSKKFSTPVFSNLDSLYSKYKPDIAEIVPNVENIRPRPKYSNTVKFINIFFFTI